MNRFPWAVALLVAGALMGPLALAAAPCAARKAATIKVTLGRQDDRVVVRRETGVVVVEIRSASGIGQADLVPGGRWPRALKVRIRGLSLARLEGFSVTTGKLTLHSSSGQKWPESREQTARGQVVERIEDRRYRLPVEVSTDGDQHTAEVTLPPEVLTGEGPLHIEWVDAYRV